MKSRVNILISAISIAVIAIASTSCAKKDKPVKEHGKSPQVMLVDGFALQPKLFQDILKTNGSIIASEEVELRSEINGRIIRILFNEGSSVSAGQLLLKMDDSELQAELKKLGVDEKLASDDLNRKTKLREVNAISQEDFDISLNKLGIIRAQKDIVQSKINKTEIRAPFSGRIGLRFVSNGAYLNPSTPIARLQSIDPAKIQFSIPEKYHHAINSTGDISFRVEGIDSIFRGRIYASETQIDPNTRTLTLRAKASNPGAILRPGSFAQVAITLQSIPDALSVPSQCIIPDIKGEKVFIVRDGLAKAVYIESGQRSENEVQVVGGLQAGDTVISTGLMQIRDGSQVRIKNQ